MGKPKLHLAAMSSMINLSTTGVQKADAELDLSLIYTTNQVRQKFTYIEEFAEGIKRNGIIEPLVVLAMEDGRYRLIVGERRFRAAPLAGLSKVPVIIKRNLTELQIRSIQVSENNDREDLHPFEEAQGVIEDVKNYGVPVAMQIWNRGESWISKRVATKRYAPEVMTILEEDLCGDFEILLCLNQMYALEESHQEFNKIKHRLADGLPLSREEARNTLARLKEWVKKQEEMAKRRTVLEGSKTVKKEELNNQASEESAALKNEIVKSLPGKTSKEKKQNYLPLLAPSEAEISAEKKLRAERELNEVHSKITKAGDANMVNFSTMKDQLESIGCDLNEEDWVLWSGFLSTILPALHIIGEDRSRAFLKRLQIDFKSTTPLDMLHEQKKVVVFDVDSSSQKPVIVVPKNWHL